MANPVTTDTPPDEMSDNPSQESLAEALRLVEQTQAAVAKIRVQVDGLARLMTELAKVNAVFESVADRLAVQGLATGPAGTGTGAVERAGLLPFVNHLAELARQTSEGTREIRKELRAHAMNAATTAVAVRQTENALVGLWNVLKQLMDRVPRPAPARAIEIETRVSGSAQLTVAALARAVAAGVWKIDMPKAGGGYKN